MLRPPQALGTVVCRTVASGHCPPVDQARTLALSLFNDPRFRYNPAILHYGLHAFDSTERAVYEAGIQFAEVWRCNVM